MHALRAQVRYGQYIQPFCIRDFCREVRAPETQPPNHPAIKESSDLPPTPLSPNGGASQAPSRPSLAGEKRPPRSPEKRVLTCGMVPASTPVQVTATSTPYFTASLGRQPQPNRRYRSRGNRRPVLHPAYESHSPEGTLTAPAYTYLADRC